MDLSQTKLFNMLKHRMEHSTERQRVISENMANLNTPGYQSKDIKQPTFKQTLREASSLTPTPTHTDHMQGTRAPEKFRSRNERKPFESFISENAVSMEDQMAKMSETTGAHQLATTLYKKSTDMMRAAVAKP